MNAMRELELEKIKGRLEEIRGELDQIATNESFAIGYNQARHTMSEDPCEEAEQEISNVSDAASRVEEAIELIQGIWT